MKQKHWQAENEVESQKTFRKYINFNRFYNTIKNPDSTGRDFFVYVFI